ncbi:uncharacterized protein [Apostichopus japonicus]|uniref:uncharacterized protein n=1 Tax=Stichopus japonicus TaxID=307972 RepID=UPI003AB27E09
MMDGLFFLSLFLLVPVLTWCEEVDVLCPQEQSLELGQGGIVNCSFATGFYGVYWYDTDDLTLSAFMFYANENKGGKGYDSGEFDILPDGSLVINIVGVKHEIPFTVVYMKTVHTISPVQKKVQLTVIAHPSLPHPQIDRCDTTQYCFTELTADPLLICTVSGSRPAIPLSWAVRTSEGDRNLTTEVKREHSNGVFRTIAKLKYQQLSLHYHLFVCKANDSNALLTASDSFVLIEVAETEVDFLNFVLPIRANAGDVITLPCPGENKVIFVWKKMQSVNDFVVIAHGYSEEHSSLNQQYSVNNEGALNITFEDKHTCIYICHSSNGIQELVTAYNVTQLDAEKTNVNVLVIILPIVILVILVLSAVAVAVFKKRDRTKQNSLECTEEYETMRSPERKDGFTEEETPLTSKTERKDSLTKEETQLISAKEDTPGVSGNQEISFKEICKKYNLDEWKTGLTKQINVSELLHSIQDPRDPIKVDFAKYILRFFHRDDEIKKEISTTQVSYKDILYLLFCCCDGNLRVKIMSVLASKFYAVPIIFAKPDDNGRLTYLTYELENLTVKYGADMEKEATISSPMFTIAALQYGETSVSKSKTLDIIFKRVQGSRNEPFATDVESKVSKGTIQTAWCVPTESSTIKQTMCFVNLQGSVKLDQETLEEKALYKLASCVVVFASPAEKHLIQPKINEHFNNKYVFWVTCPLDQTDSNNVKIQEEKNKSMTITGSKEYTIIGYHIFDKVQQLVSIDMEVLCKPNKLVSLIDNSSE